MSRHRNVRNRAYSYEYDEYDEDYEDDTPHSPSTEQYLYQRNGQSLHSVEDSASPNTPNDSSTILDNDILNQCIPQLKAIVSANQSQESQFIDALRSTNYNLDQAAIILLEQETSETISSNNVSGTKLQKCTESSTIQTPTSTQTVALTSSQTTTLPPENPSETLIESTTLGNPPLKVTLSESKRLTYQKAEETTQQQALRLESLKTNKVRINLIVIGHVDAGKSTIMGHLLFQLGYVSPKLMHKYEKESKIAGKSSFKYAWVTDADQEERARGVTMDIGLKFFETASKCVTLLDAPGHKDFIPKMITGATQADVALLVVPASTGAFEGAFENSGQTKEHTLLIKSLGVTQIIVAINKMDTIAWDPIRYQSIVDSLKTYLQRVGFRKHISFVPVSGILGTNLSALSEVSRWYEGPSLLQAIDEFSAPQRPISKPFRMGITDVSKSLTLGQCVSGRIYTGAVAPGSSLMVMPAGMTLIVKAIEMDGKALKMAIAGDIVDIGVSGIDAMYLTSGSILCSISHPIKCVKRFQAKIVTMSEMQVPLIKGSSVILYLHHIDEPAFLTHLVSIFDKNGNLQKKRPRCIPRDTSALVEISTQRAICIELSTDFRALGRFAIRDRGNTIAAGIVMSIMS
uniref:Translation elongation factor 1alpha putative n=1 Tax=Albugo laibachii Nc14 TaxID=890382 RepID=F0WDF1_9STRA|nr:translation elongation factor 1alpha putative [Albugo laibachii Nc14]|eukprot:CCA19223.1 translation elongation factor 1alpha putative [Albugo laibachii Nc14]